MDGTLIEGWTSIKSFRPKGDGGDEDLPARAMRSGTVAANGARTRRMCPRPAAMPASIPEDDGSPLPIGDSVRPIEY